MPIVVDSYVQRVVDDIDRCLSVHSRVLVRLIEANLSHVRHVASTEQEVLTYVVDCGEWHILWVSLCAVANTSSSLRIVRGLSCSVLRLYLCLLLLLS